jgi:hypothetical protein
MPMNMQAYLTRAHKIFAHIVLLAYLPLAFAHGRLHNCDRAHDGAQTVFIPKAAANSGLATHGFCVACHFVAVVPPATYRVNGINLVVSRLCFQPAEAVEIFSPQHFAARAPPLNGYCVF